MLAQLQSELPPRDDGEPLSVEEVALLLRIEWDEVDEFIDLSEHQRQQLREATLVRWLIDNFEIVATTLRGTQDSLTGRPSPGLAGDALRVADAQRRGVTAVADVLSGEEYETARDAVFSAADQLDEEHFYAARNAAEVGRQALKELLDVVGDADADEDASMAASDDLRGHLMALHAAADQLVRAAQAAIDGQEKLADKAFADARDDLDAAGGHVDQLLEELQA
jgi:hypothetical protein